MPQRRDPRDLEPGDEIHVDLHKRAGTNEELDPFGWLCKRFPAFDRFLKRNPHFGLWFLGFIVVVMVVLFATGVIPWLGQHP